MCRFLDTTSAIHPYVVTRTVAVPLPLVAVRLGGLIMSNTVIIDAIADTDAAAVDASVHPFTIFLEVPLF
jgi:hypothetical protein